MVNEKIVYDPTINRTPLNSAAIKEKIDNNKLKVKSKNKPVKEHKAWLSKKVHKALEEKAKAEGKTADEKAAEIVEQKAKPKPKRQKESKSVTYPLDARINGYNFMHFSNALLADLGWHVDMKLKVDKNADGSVTLRKA